MAGLDRVVRWETAPWRAAIMVEINDLPQDGRTSLCGRETDIEDCILAHPAVLLVAVVGVPDAIRGEIVKAFIVPRPGIAAGPKLADEIQGLVRDRLAAYQYPRAVEFVDSLPMTATGKIMRRILRERATGIGKAQPSRIAEG